MSCLKLYVHLVWSTHERKRLITPEVEKRLWALIAARCKALRSRAIEVGGIPDHVHGLVEFPPDLALSTLIRDLKGGSSYAMSHLIAPGLPFRWQEGYGAFTIRKEDVPIVARYIRDQKSHHTQGTACADWETGAVSPKSEAVEATRTVVPPPAFGPPLMPSFATDLQPKCPSRDHESTAAPHLDEPLGANPFAWNRRFAGGLKRPGSFWEDG